MPIYEYRCENCGHQLETIQKVSEAPLITCPECEQDALKKRISAGAFRLKGGGWYETDFKSKNKRNVADGSDSSSSGGGSASDSAKDGASDGASGGSSSNSSPDSGKSSKDSASSGPSSGSNASSGSGSGKGGSSSGSKSPAKKD